MTVSFCCNSLGGSLQVNSLKVHSLKVYSQGMTIQGIKKYGNVSK